MLFTFTGISIFADTPQEIQAFKLFSKELQKRTLNTPIKAEAEASADFVLKIDSNIKDDDTFSIVQSDSSFIFRAKTIRGLIFAYSLFLRKAVFKNNNIVLEKYIAGVYTPDKEIRGHQLGYRPLPNTYDAWSYDQYHRYYLDLMAFGVNTVEHIFSAEKDYEKNELMRYDQEDLLLNESKESDKLNLDFSLWVPNSEKETEDEALKSRENLFKKIKRINYFFPPGGDPGSMKSGDFINRCIKISKTLKKYHPYAKMQPSAQAPHQYRDWGNDFIAALKKEPEEIDAVITGPNHAYPLEELRKLLPSKYPIRFYPDITHNLRCEYPVNFLENNWHFSFANTMSRETCNPRPTELVALNKSVSQYTVGGVSYSEGVHDDLNKMVWSSLLWDKTQDIKEILLDYARFFMYGADEEKIAEVILLLEKNWQGEAYINPTIDYTYKLLCELKNDYPFLMSNWRFVLLYFRGCCDKLVKSRQGFEKKLIAKAIAELQNMNISSALSILNTKPKKEYLELRNELNFLGEKLFNLIGIQLNTSELHCKGWDRGATLNTIDNNVTDLKFLKVKLQEALNLDINKQKEFINSLLNRTTVEDDEIYFSVALNGLKALGVSQKGEYYLNVQGDYPAYQKYGMPMAITIPFDNYSFFASFGGLDNNSDYILTVTYKMKNKNVPTDFQILCNGHCIYRGALYGGSENKRFDEINLVNNFKSFSYKIKSEYIDKGTINLAMEESNIGFEICELWIKKDKIK